MVDDNKLDFSVLEYVVDVGWFQTVVDADLDRAACCDAVDGFEEGGGVGAEDANLFLSSAFGTTSSRSVVSYPACTRES